MKMILSALSLCAALALSACATVNASDSYQARLSQLDADCRERGGTLQPTGAMTGKPETEYLCRITQASRIRNH